MIKPGWRMIAVDGAEVWAYVAGDKIEGNAGLAAAPLRATIDGADYLITATRIGATTFEADIHMRAPANKKTDTGKASNGQ